MNADRQEIEALAAFAQEKLDLANARLSDEYYYGGLPHCVIDSVYSIGVRYPTVQATVKRYCSHAGLAIFRPSRDELPNRESQQSISAFCQLFEEVGLEDMTAKVFTNRQRTSPRGGILKAEAVFQVAQVLQRHRIERLQDIEEIGLTPELEREVRSIPGQHSGISYEYFQMLAGSDQRIKPDRMILRFIKLALGREVSISEAKMLLVESVEELRKWHSHLTPRLLDYVVWSYQRER